ncbi:hypothetical protein PLESTF_001972000 [Pleodorina starrii]|nr:hypothetical protein PLESTF_000987200 [Pleodorina starrii]GLC77679.1 hypothetical protein PLESTF_001972000 [Pleodorina starrii]
MAAPLHSKGYVPRIRLRQEIRCWTQGPRLGCGDGAGAGEIRDGLGQGGREGGQIGGPGCRTCRAAGGPGGGCGGRQPPHRRPAGHPAQQPGCPQDVAGRGRLFSQDRPAARRRYVLGRGGKEGRRGGGQGEKRRASGRGQGVDSGCMDSGCVDAWMREVGCRMRGCVAAR